MKTSILSPLFLFSFFIFATLIGITPPARAINLNSLPSTIKEEVEAKFPSLLEPHPPLHEVDRALQYLMSKGVFEKAQVIDHDGSWTLDVSILKTINEINFQGLESFEPSEIQPFLQIERGQKFDSRLLYETRDKIKGFYADQGFLNSVLDVSLSEGADNKVDLNFKIQEGQALRINSIEIFCPNPELLKKLNARLKRHKKSIFQTQLSNQITKEITEYLTANHYFRAAVNGPTVHLNKDKTEAHLTYRIDRTESYNINFTGNYMIPSPRLLSALELYNMSGANPNIMPELLSKLKEFYWKRGYARVEVKGQEKVFQANIRSHLNFEIIEGNPVKIEKLEFSGSLSKPQSFYSDFLEDHSGDTVRKNLFHRNDFENGLKNLITELQNNGYLKAKLISSRYLYNSDKTAITIAVNIEEGPLTTIKDIQFDGLQLFSKDELLKQSHLQIGMPLRLAPLEEAIRTIKTYSQEKGFIEFRILNEKENLVTYSGDNTEAHILFSIEEGPKVKVANVLIDGNSLTKEVVFRHELQFKEGDILTPSKIEESTKRLQRLGLFNSVEIKMLENRTQIADRTIVVKVSERAPGLFNIGAGFTNERQITVRGFAGLAYRNINGLGRAFTTRAEVNYTVNDLRFPELKLTAGYVEPYLFESLTKGRVNFTRAIQITDFVNKIGTDSYQIDFLLERQWTSHILFTYDLWNISQLSDFAIDPDKGFAGYGATQTILNLASTGPAVEWDYRDHPFNPSKGTLTRIQMEYSDPLLGNSEDIAYLRSTGSFTYYQALPMKRPMVFANSLRFGDLVNLKPDGIGVPYDKKGFVLGGISTIRGFEAGTAERFPSDIDLGVAAGERYALKERAQFFLIKSEVRFPLFGSVGGAFFYDGGLVSVDNLKFKDPYRDSAGFGIRYSTPVGPANMEFAWKLDADKYRNESPFRLHISIGTF